MQVKGIEVTVGCDPEFFLREEFKPISAHFLIDKFGGKHNPLKLDNGAVQVDGTAVEFNTDPAKTADEFVNNVDKVLLQVRGRIPEKFEFAFIPVQRYTNEAFAEIPPDAKELGCDPDYNAYTMTVNEKPDVALPWRTGAGHIHVGWVDNKLDVESSLTRLECAALVRQLDSVLYPASHLWDKDKDRRKMYGAPGAFRVKPYGVEYRVLSNVWVKHKPIQKWIFEATIKSFELLMDGVVIPKWKWENLNPDDYYGIRRYVESLTNEYGLPAIPPTYQLVG